MTESELPTGPHELELGTLDLLPALEAVLMVADQPLDHLTLAQAVGHPPTDVEQALNALADEYTEQGRGFELRNIAGGWRFFTREAYAGAVERFILDGQQARLTQAALETMAVVAYRQPISRTRISAIRGVNVDSVVRTLVTRGLVEESDVDPESGAILYRTTSYFLERMGMGSIDELPDIAPLLPEIDDMDDELTIGAVTLEAPTEAEEPDTLNADRG
jgi:segregation and condensation protein B